MKLDVTLESHAYVLGFLQGDGHMQKPKARGEQDQRGAVQVEIGHYNLMVWSEGAQKICHDLYQGASVFLPRKRLKAVEALSWSRR